MCLVFGWPISIYDGVRLVMVVGNIAMKLAVKVDSGHIAPQQLPHPQENVMILMLSYQVQGYLAIGSQQIITIIL